MDAAMIYAGEQEYHKGDAVFAVWGDAEGPKRRWYAAFVLGPAKHSNLLIEWGEGGTQAVVPPRDMVRARQLLKPDTRVHVHDSDKNDFYQEVLIIRYLSHHRYEVRGKRGRVFSVSFSDMMIDDIFVEIFRRKRAKQRLPPKWMIDYPYLWYRSPHLFLSEHWFIFTTPSKLPPEYSVEKWEKIKKKMAAIIECRGGKVVNSMEELLQVEIKRFRFLIAPDSCQTVKFYQALAASIPCMCPEWILRMQRKDMYIEDNSRYRLPTQRGSRGEPTVLWGQERPLTLFDNLRVCLVQNQDPEFCSTWTLAVKAGQGIVTCIPDAVDDFLDMEAFDVVVGRNSISGGLKDQFEENNIPVVAEQWLVKSLIYGEKPEYDHPAFFLKTRRDSRKRTRSLEVEEMDPLPRRSKYRSGYLTENGWH
ncbi:uncharacterized protein LOC129582679 [Paramacrobiotus metropolitanus]|uniref:uncharacterized protein LOC129582679 n=1 Tax=Paramacrobiotus metropolitanus TaxID=2943436 RepID=UPI00244627E6|nr:uncharacterized protein LOC129582679 [Paramacrobiotus metropolitanus]